ncbi:hypothetical protein O0L34_g14032 [Tuta absoluta]|nr:hypothetical protein O0L34_g14032 [Tuta absoluta]
MIYSTLLFLVLVSKVNGDLSHSSSVLENGKPILRSQSDDTSFTAAEFWVATLKSGIVDLVNEKGYEDAQPYIEQLVKDAEKAHKVKFKVNGEVSLVIDSIKGETDYDRERERERQKRKKKRIYPDDPYKCPWSTRAGPLGALCGSAQTGRHRAHSDVVVGRLGSYMTSSEETLRRTRRDDDYYTDEEEDKDPPASWVRELKLYGKYLWEKLMQHPEFIEKQTDTVFHIRFHKVIDDYEKKYNVDITDWKSEFELKYKPKGYKPHQV